VWPPTFMKLKFKALDTIYEGKHLIISVYIQCGYLEDWKFSGTLVLSREEYAVLEFGDSDNLILEKGIIDV
jgi:hypothetical protein